MKISIKCKDYSKYHYWFSWYPIHIGNTWVWLEWVERKVTTRMYGYDPIHESHYRLTSDPID